MKRNYMSIGFGLANVIFLSGIIVMILALIYMALNLYRADLIIRNWVPLLAAGLSLTFIGIIMKPQILKGRAGKKLKMLRFKY